MMKKKHIGRIFVGKKQFICIIILYILQKLFYCSCNSLIDDSKTGDQLAVRQAGHWNDLMSESDEEGGDHQ